MKISSSAFSLVELLVTIAVIAVIAAVGIPTIGPIVYAADTMKDKRNAQTIVSIYNFAVAAGLPTSSVATPEDAIQLLAAGTNVITKTGQVLQFSIDGLTDSEMQTAERFLELRDGQLAFLAAGNH